DDILITLKDTGIGMDRETLKKVFDPFFTTRGVEGTGLGLSVSYGIITRHEGELSIDSKPGEGTTVSIKLPSAVPVKKRVTERRKPAGPASILVIDDEPGAREILHEILIREKHRVKTAASGTEGLEIFEKRKRIDVVITDLGMPGMSGWEVSKRIKEKSPGTAVVMITGWGTQLDKKKMKECGVDRVIAKPFQINQILSVICDCLKSKKKG
ncbi:MAG: response regulator, partial [Fidelibacterota bacterium]